MVYFYDIECLINFFSITFKNRETKEVLVFYIHESDDQLNALYDFLDNKGIYLVGVNCLNYDSQLLELLLSKKKDWYWTFPDIKEIIDTIYNWSQEIISSLFPKYPEWKLTFKHLDLIAVWHFLNRAKMTSLKAVEVAIRFKNVQDMPFSHTHYVTKEEIPSILGYNLNDVNATEEWYWITKGVTELPLYKGKDKIALRNSIQKEYNIKCLNYNDIKIGDEINKQAYISLSGNDWSDIKQLKTIRERIIVKDIIASFINFKTSKFNGILDYLKSKVITNTKNGISKTIKLNDNLVLVLKQGGLHTEDKPKIFNSDDKFTIVDFDVDSFYPSTILLLKLYPEHLGKEWLQGYEKMYHQRIFAKKNRKVDKKYETINEALKLSLNGSYGKTGEERSWQFDPLVTMSVTVNCQLFIMMIVEELITRFFNVISCNTDGVTVLCENERVEELREIFNQFTLNYKYTFEETIYKKLVRTSINDYIALKLDNKLKLKGDFEIDKELHKNCSNRIRAIALALYYIEGIPLKETIENPKEEYKIGADTFKGYGIFDYILFVKGKSNQYYNLEVPVEDSLFCNTYLLPRNIRYYISNGGGRLTKHYTGGKKEKESIINVGYKATLANLIEDNDISKYDLNFNFYLDECLKIVNTINDYLLIKSKTKKLSKKEVATYLQPTLF